MAIGHNEELLVKQAQTGDKAAIGQLWDALTPKLFGYLVNTLQDKATAEDVLQTTWVKAIDSLPRYQPRGIGFDAWLFAISRNECRQHWRRTKREIPLDSEAHDIPDTSSESAHDTIMVNQILRGLTDDDQEILRLRYIADLPMNDIAKVLNLNFVTVRVRIHRALARARAHAVTQSHNA